MMLLTMVVVLIEVVILKIRATKWENSLRVSLHLSKREKRPSQRL